MMQSYSSDNCVHCYNIKIVNPFHPELQLVNSKPTIKNKLKELLDYKKRNNRKIFHSSAKLIGSNSDIDEAFESMHQVYANNIVFILKIRLCSYEVVIKSLLIPFSDFYKIVV